MARPWLICTEFLKAIEENNCETVNGILDTGFDIDTNLKVQRTAISICVSNGLYDMARLLMTRGCSLSLKTDKGETPLHLAVLRSDYSLVKLLLENRADLTSIDRLKRTVLHYACELGLLDITTLLLENSSLAIINMKDGEKKTPLIYACQYGCISMISHLLSKGAEINTADFKGNSPLIHAFSNSSCSIELISLLLDAGANINHTNGANETALQNAIRTFTPMYNSSGKFRDMLLLLIERGSDLSAKNIFCESTLHLALGLQDEIVIRKLLNFGSDVNERNALGASPLIYACRKPDFKILSLLLNAGATLDGYVYYNTNPDVTDYTSFELQYRPKKSISIFHLLGNMRECPPALSHLCRTSIRRNLPKNMEDGAAQLPLPKSLIRYILLID